MGTLVQVLGWVVAAVAALGAAFTLGMRTGFGPLRDGIRRMNRRFANPAQLRTAGQPGARASVVEHVGRRSGATYRTPVVLQPSDGGFLVALPYGSGTDWVRNVVAAGGATLRHEGATVRVGAPVVLGLDEANPAFPTSAQRQHRLFGVREFLLLQPQDVAGG